MESKKQSEYDKVVPVDVERTKTPDFDEVMEELELFGRYQIILIIGLFSAACVTSMHILGGTIMAASVSYECSQVIVQAQNCNFSKELTVSTTINIFNSTLTKQEDNCFKYAVDISINNYECQNLTNAVNEMHLNSTKIQSSSLSALLSSIVFSTNASQAKCESWNYDQSIYKSTAVMDLNLVCSDSWKKEMSQIILMCGVLVGAFLLGFLSDRIGRKASCCIACIIISISTIGTTFVWSYTIYCLLQFFTGLAGMGLFVSGYVNAMEHVNNNWRVACGQFLQCAFSVGFMLLALLGYFVRDWRTLNMAFSMFLPIFVIIFWKYAMESPRWLFSNHKTKKVQKVLKKIAKINKKKIDVTTFQSFFETISSGALQQFPNPQFIAGLLPNPHFSLKRKSLRLDLGKQETPLISKDESSAYKPLTLIDLLKNTTLLKITSILCYNWFAVTCVYYGLAFIVTEIDGDPYLNLFLSGFIELPANFIAIFIINKWGRRPTVSTCNLICGAALVLTQFFLNCENAKLVLYLIGKFGATATFSCIYTYTSELYPTPLRGQGVGFCSSCARIGGLTSVAIIMVRYYVPYLPFVLYGWISLSAGVVVLLLPETKGCLLPDAIEDCEKQYKDRHVSLKDQYLPNFA